MTNSSLPNQITPLPQNQLEEKILQLAETDQFPFKVAKKNGKFVFSDQLINAEYYVLFGLGKHYSEQNYIVRLEESTHTAHYIMESKEMTYILGLPLLFFSGGYNRGQTFGWQTKKAWGMNRQGEIGKLYDSTINYQTHNHPLEAFFTENGWQWKRQWVDSTMVKMVIWGVVLTIAVFAAMVYIISG